VGSKFFEGVVEMKNTVVVYIDGVTSYGTYEKDLGFWDIYVPHFLLRVSIHPSELEGSKDYKITYADGTFRVWVKVSWVSPGPTIPPTLTITTYANKDIYFDDRPCQLKWYGGKRILRR
jgi:hypothetical protein